MTRIKQQDIDIQQLDYSPAIPYRLDLEIFSVSDLRRRGSKKKLRTMHRYTFHTLVFVTEGTSTQWIDFAPVACQPGSLLIIRSGQAHNFGKDEEWDGLIILFRTEFLLPKSVPTDDMKLVVNLQKFPEHFRLDGHEQRTVLNVITQMHEDTMIEESPENVNALLRYQLYTLLSRLAIIHDRKNKLGGTNSCGLQRCKRFQQLVELNFSRWHQVSEYARHLGCTEKSLTRAAIEVVGLHAKVLITSRINLEAKRLLVHSDLPVSLIGKKLGFEEATNFSKFFKREAGCTPTEFRQRQAALWEKRH